MTSADTHLHYEIHGQGEPLIMIPGLAAGAWIWFRQMQTLAAKFRVITFDPPGISRSAPGSEPLTIRSLAEQTAGLLRELGIEQAHILGASWGGFVAQEFGLAFPEMTRSLILCCTSFGGPNHVAPSMETLIALASNNGFNTEERVRRTLLPAFSTEAVRDRPEEVDRVVWLRLENPVREETFREQLAAAMGFDAESRLAALQMPVLVISGDADRIVPVENSRNLAARIPGAELVQVAGGSHLFFIEQAQEFGLIVSDFLQRRQVAVAT
jgi:pimeloyl-ACP methyl ester carboxylesterase